MLKCPFCNKQYKTRNGFSKHLNTHIDNNIEKERLICDIIFGRDIVNEELKKYKNEEVCIYTLSIGIGKLIKLLGLKRTSSEERKTKRYKDKYKTTLMERYGVDNVSKIDFVKKKKEQTLISNYGSLEKGYEKSVKSMRNFHKNLTKEQKEQIDKKRKNTLYNNHGVYCLSHLPGVTEKQKNTRKKYLETLTFKERQKMTESARKSVTHRGGAKNNKIENIIKQALILLKEDFKEQEFMFGYSWDFVIYNRKIIIEVQGDYWHGNPNIYKASDLVMKTRTVQSIWDKDYRKTQSANSKGFRVVCIWETDIHKNKNNIVDYVRTLIEKDK